SPSEKVSSRPLIVRIGRTVDRRRGKSRFLGAEHQGSATTAAGRLVIGGRFASIRGTQGNDNLFRNGVVEHLHVPVGHGHWRPAGVWAAPPVIRIKVHFILHDLEGEQVPTEPARVKAIAGARNGTRGRAAYPEDGVLILGATDAHAGVVPNVGHGDRVVVATICASVGQSEIAGAPIAVHLGRHRLGADHNGIGGTVGNLGD